MKSAVIPQIRVEPELRAELGSVLRPGETLTQVVETTLRDAIAFRHGQIALDARVQVCPRSTFSFRKAAQNPAQRELSTAMGGMGHVALDEIVSPSRVVVRVVRDQRDEDHT